MATANTVQERAQVSTVYMHVGALVQAITVDL